MNARQTNTKRLTATLIILLTLATLTSQTQAAGFPDTSTCSNTATVTIDFPTSTTISKDYLSVFSCQGDSDWNAGDFVTAWIEDLEGSPVYSISQFVETNAGVEWVSPLSDANGLAWDRITINPKIFDCNSTGVQYTIYMNWDGQTTTQDFKVYCPTLTLRKYRTELPHWETLHIEVEVEDHKGLRMKNIPCTATILNFQLHEDTNSVKIEQQTETVYTTLGGRAWFDFPSGLTTSLLQGFEYVATVECLGGDTNFSFQVVKTNPQYLNNPLYNFMTWIGENFIALFFGLIIGLVIFAVVGLLIKQVTQGA